MSLKKDRQKAENATASNGVGIVYDCVRLNMRSAPSMTSRVIGVLPSGTQVDVAVKQSTDDFYKVRYITDKYEIIDGYCKREYIRLFDSSRPMG